MLLSRQNGSVKLLPILPQAREQLQRSLISHCCLFKSSHWTVAVCSYVLSNGAHQFKSLNIHRGNKVLKPSSALLVGRSMLLASTAKSWGWTGFCLFILFLLMAVVKKLKSSQSSCFFSSRLGPAAPVGSKIIFIDEVMQSDWVLIVLILFRDRKRSLFWCWWALCAHPEYWIYYNMLFFAINFRFWST